MAILTLKVDTVENTLEASVDGTTLDNVRCINVYAYGPQDDLITSFEVSQEQHNGSYHQRVLTTAAEGEARKDDVTAAFAAWLDRRPV